MPRRKKRRKPYSAADWTTQRAKARFPFSLFSNARIFYVVGTLIMVGGLGAGAIATGVGRSTTTDTFATPEASGSVTPEATAEAQVFDAPPPLTIDTGKQYFATINTDKGEIRVELLADEAPETVNNFVFLAQEGFYDDLSFFFVDPAFVAQTGDPTGAGQGGPGYDLPQESPVNTFTQGDLAMVNGSQFFITYQDLDLSGVAAQERSEFTPFGHVVEGMDVLASLTPRNPSMRDAPPADRIVSIDIEEGGAGT